MYLTLGLTLAIKLLPGVCHKRFLKRRLWWTQTIADKAITMPQICQMHAYTGLQARIKDKNQFSEYSPSVEHSLIESIRLFCCICSFICPRTLTSFSHHLTTGRIYWIIVSKESNYKSKPVIQVRSLRGSPWVGYALPVHRVRAFGSCEPVRVVGRLWWCTPWSQ